MSYLKTGDKSVGYFIGVAIGAFIIGALVVCGQAWLLGVILSWFGVSLTFGQNLIIVLLVNSLLGAVRSN